MKPINLNQRRKEKTRAEAKAQADVNAVKHGRTKAQRMADVRRLGVASAQLDGQKFDDEA